MRDYRAPTHAKRLAASLSLFSAQPSLGFANDGHTPRLLQQWRILILWAKALYSWNLDYTLKLMLVKI